MPRKKPLVDFEELYDSCDDITKDYMPADTAACDYTSEVTVTFDPRRFTRGAAFEAHRKIVTYLASWHPIREMIVVTEYQKNGMPHYHINIGSDEPFPDGWSFDTIRAFNRFYGMTTCRPIVNHDDWQKYLFKDVKANNEKYRFPHYIYYYLK